jgi:hypothetical protein
MPTRIWNVTAKAGLSKWETEATAASKLSMGDCGHRTTVTNADNPQVGRYWDIVLAVRKASCRGLRCKARSSGRVSGLAYLGPCC